MAAGTLELVQTPAVGGQLRFVPPKTEDSSRTVPLPHFCLNALKEHAERQADERDRAPHTSPASGISTATSEKKAHHGIQGRRFNNGAIAGLYPVSL